MCTCAHVYMYVCMSVYIGEEYVAISLVTHSLPTHAHSHTHTHSPNRHILSFISRSAFTSKVSKLHDFGGAAGASGAGGGEVDSVTSVVWMGGSHLVVGMNSGSVQVWDVSQGKCVREMESHTARWGTRVWRLVPAQPCVVSVCLR